MIRTAVNEIGISGFGVGVLSGIRRGAAAILARLIPQFNGSDNYATLDVFSTLGDGDSVEITASMTQYTSGGDFLFDGEFGSAADRVYVSIAANTGELSWNGVVTSGVTLDGVPTVKNVTVFPDDGAEHVVIATTDATAKFGTIGTNYLAQAKFRGHIPSFKTTISSVETEYVLDDKAPTGITYTNFDPVVDWHNYKFNTPLDRWDYQGSGIAGSQLMQFEGTATTPLSSTITVTGSTWEMNWEGLLVEHYISGAGAYTYLAAPDGVPMRCDIHDIDSVTAYSMINEKTTVQSVDNALAAFAESITRVPRVCDVTLTGNSIPTAAGLLNKAIIEAEGGTVLVDS